MSIAVLKSRALAGMQALEVSVEVHLANGLPAFHIVGLADTEVKESRDRVRAAILNTGYDMAAVNVKRSGPQPPEPRACSPSAAPNCPTKVRQPRPCRI